MVTWIVTTLIGLGALVILSYLFWWGMSRARRLRGFVEQRSGMLKTGAAFGITGRVGRLFGEKRQHVGYAAQLPGDDQSVYLFDVHHQLDEPPRHTAVLHQTAGEAGTSSPLVLRERIPPLETDGRDFDRRFAVEGADPAELSDDLKTWLLESAGERSWLLEARRRGDDLLVMARDRPLQREDEWATLIAQARRLTGVWT
jgi:hypothetical protein